MQPRSHHWLFFPRPPFYDTVLQSLISLHSSMHFSVTFVALFIVLTQTTPISNFGSDLSNDSSEGLNEIDPTNAINPASPLDLPVLEAQKKLYEPQNGVGYRAPKYFDCPSVEESGSHKYCGYFNRYYYVCERGLPQNCYRGYASSDTPPRICTTLITAGPICVLFDGTQKSFRIDDSDLDIWKHKDEPLEDPTKIDNQQSTDDQPSFFDNFICGLGFC